MIGWMFDQAVKWLAGFVKDMLNTVWKLLADTLFHLPDVTGLPQVRDLTAKSLMVVNISYVLFIMAAGVVAMTHGTVQARHSAGDLLPRLCFGLAIANFGTWICQQVIGAGNALVLALTGEGIASDKSLTMLLNNLLNDIVNPAALLLSVIIGLLIAVLVLLLLVGWIVRFAVLIIVCGTAPLALACHGLPWTDPIAQLWWKTLGGVTATVVLQAVTLHTSLSILLNPSTNLASTGWPFDPSGVLNLLVVAVLMWVTVRIPGQVKQYVAGSRGRPNVMGTIVRLVIVQQLTRGLGGVARGASRTGTARPSGPGRPDGGGGGGNPGAAGPGPRRPAPSPAPIGPGGTGAGGRTSGRGGSGRSGGAGTSGTPPPAGSPGTSTRHAGAGGPVPGAASPVLGSTPAPAWPAWPARPVQPVRAGGASRRDTGAGTLRVVPGRPDAASGRSGSGEGGPGPRPALRLVRGSSPAAGRPPAGRRPAGGGR